MKQESIMQIPKESILLKSLELHNLKKDITSLCMTIEEIRMYYAKQINLS